jgi:hypothetical protein
VNLWLRRSARLFVALVVGGGLSAMWLLLHVLKYRGTIRLLSALAPPQSTGRAGPWAHRVAAWVQHSQVRWYGVRFRCIHRALLIWWALRWWRVDAELVSGAVEESNGALLIHAWVESHGLPLGERSDNIARFTRLWPQLGAASIVHSDWRRRR